MKTIDKLVEIFGEKDFMGLLNRQLEYSIKCICEAHKNILSSDNKIPTLEEIIGGSNQKSQDLTKLLTNIFTGFLYNFMKEKTGEDVKKEVNSYDMDYNNTFIENKLTKATNFVIKSWVGNKPKKVETILLAGYNFNFEENKVDGYFLAIVDLNECNSKWHNSSSDNTNYCTLKILKSDLDKVHIIHGSIKPSERDCKYLQFVCEKI